MNVETTARLREASSSLGNQSRSGSGPGEALGKQDFLNLLLTQVTHQDPLNPLDSSGMMNQLAQMGSLEQLANVNTTLERLTEGQAEQNRANAQFYLGRDVTVEGDRLRLLGGQSDASLRFQLPEDSSQTALNIYNEEGQRVRRLALGPLTAGLHQIPWDGQDEQGSLLNDGIYRFEATALDRLEAPLDAKTFTRGRVAGLRFSEGQNYLLVDGKPWRTSDVLELSARSEQRYLEREPLPLRRTPEASPLQGAPAPEED